MKPMKATIKQLKAFVAVAQARTTRSLALTPEGKAFYPVAQRLVADWDNAFTDINNLFSMRRGRLRIAAMPSFASSLLPSTLAHYRRQHPNIDIAVQDVVAENVVDMVRTGRVEIGVSFDPGEYDDLHFEVLFEDKFFVAVPKQHVLTQKKNTFAGSTEFSVYCIAKAVKYSPVN
jgi:LysR family carnitine catabolism transcriptional activator